MEPNILTGLSISALWIFVILGFYRMDYLQGEIDKLKDRLDFKEILDGKKAPKDV